MIWFNLMSFTYKSEKFLMVSHDSLNCYNEMQETIYDVGQVNRWLFDGPETWSDSMLVNIRNCLEDIEIMHMFNTVSPCYYYEDLKMVINTTTVVMDTFNKAYNVIENAS